MAKHSPFVFVRTKKCSVYTLYYDVQYWYNVYVRDPYLSKYARQCKDHRPLYQFVAINIQIDTAFMLTLPHLEGDSLFLDQSSLRRCLPRGRHTSPL